MKKSVLLLSILSLAWLVPAAQDLPRGASFGVMVTNPDDSTRATQGLAAGEGTLVQRVFDGSSAYRAGIAAGDVLVALGGEPIADTRGFLQLIKKYHGGDRVKMHYVRKARRRTVAMVLHPKPKETSDRFDIVYSSVVSGGNRLRTIITRPRGKGPYPAVMLIGGVGCYSVDNPTVKMLRSGRMWVDSLTVNGFVTLRVEKTGMGDSQGIPCSECDFVTEKQGWLDGLRQLKALPYVDRENIFLAGFSMGGVIGPLLAQQEAVRGLVVYGTVGRNWLEYELENTRRQQQLDGCPADSLDMLMRAEYKRLYGLFVEKKTPEEIMKEHPETASVFFNYPMRVEYFQQVAAIDIGTLWMNTDAYVLAMHGASDFVSSAYEHRLIADIVNRYHPGKATFSEIPACDHWELYAETERASQQHTATEVNPLAMQTALRWMLEKVKS